MERPFERSGFVTVFGGSGFVGRHLVRALVRRGWRVKVAVRRPELTAHLQPLGAMGQIAAVRANVRNPRSVEAAVAGASAVVNLVGILAEGGAQRFEAVQAEGAANVAGAVAAAGIARFVQMSAIGAAPGSASAYARTKAKGEASALAAVPEAVVVRPSIQFGPEDSFFNRFAALARISPVLPLVGADTRFQPIFVGDVAAAIAMAVDGEVPGGRIYEFGGPEILTFRRCMETMLREIDRRRLLLPIPFGAAAVLASILELLPGKLKQLTVDQVRQLEVDNVVSAQAKAEGRTLAGIGIAPTGMEAILPLYLTRYRPRGQFDRRRPA